MDDLKKPLLESDNDAYSKTHLVGGSIQHTNYSSITAPEPPPPYDVITSFGRESIHPSEGIESAVSSQPEQIKVYKRRWYVLIMFSLIAGTQGAVWNTFGPIAASSKDAFGWDDATIALLNNWGPISYLISSIFFSWMMDVKGLRIACLITAFLIVLGTALRCITMDAPAVTWLMHLGQMFNGLAGPVAMAGPPAVSSVWFPTHQRTTATAIGTAFANAGTAIGFIIGPLLVPDVLSNSTNNSASSLFIKSASFYHSASYSESFAGSWGSQASANSSGNSSDARRSNEKKAIHLYMYIEAGWAVALFLIILIYFPKKPPLPPCTSAALQRENFLVGLMHLIKHGQFWLVAGMYGISTGVLNCWASVLDVILSPHGIGEIEAGWIGFYATCAACNLSLIVARFADIFSRIMKRFILFLYLVGTAAFLIFTLATIGVLPATTVLLYTTIIVGNMVLNAAVPLIFELACELAYPTGEGTTNGVLTTVNNFVGLVFLFVLMIPNIGSMWTNWTVVGSAGIGLPLLMLMREQYNRLEIDRRNPNMDNINTDIVIPPPDI